MKILLIRYLTLCMYTLPAWVILRRPWKRPLLREIALACFALLMAPLLIMTLDGKWASPAQMLGSAITRLAEGDNINFIPFRILGGQLQTITSEASWTQVLGNILLFMPWGFFLPLLWRRFRSLPKLMGMAFLLTFCIEFSQLFIGRMTDVDDMLLNFIGSMAGSGVWALLHRRFPQTDVLAR